MNQKLFGKDHRLVGRALSGLGATLADEGRLVDAESVLREALATQRKALGNDNLDMPWTLHFLGWAPERQGKFAEAENSYREAQTIRKRLSANPRGHLLLRLVSVLRKQGKLSEGEATVRDAIASFRKQADAGEIDAQNAVAWLLATYPDSEVRNGHLAIHYAEKAVAATSRANAMYLDTLAAAYAEAGDFAKAIHIQKEAIALNKNEALNAELATRLKLYESGSPYRDRE